MTAARTIRLAPEYGCWPLWDDATGDNLEPESLPIPPELAERIRAWDDRFQATLNDAYPPDSAFPSPEAEDIWLADAEAIYRALSDHLGADRVCRRS